MSVPIQGSGRRKLHNYQVVACGKLQFLKQGFLQQWVGVFDHWTAAFCWTSVWWHLLFLRPEARGVAPVRCDFFLGPSDWVPERARPAGRPLQQPSPEMLPLSKCEETGGRAPQAPQGWGRLEELVLIQLCWFPRQTHWVSARACRNAACQGMPSPRVTVCAFGTWFGFSSQSVKGILITPCRAPRRSHSAITACLAFPAVPSWQV